MNSSSISNKLHKVTALLGVTTMLFMVASCSSGTAQVAASPDSSVSASPVDPKAGDVIKGIPTKKELANNGKGDYIQTTISDDDSAMKFDPALVSTPTVFDLFTKDEIADAQKFIMRFIAEEAIDSQINDNSADVANIDAWWAKNKDKVAPQYQEEFLASLKSDDTSKAMVFRTHFRKYSLAYGADKTHVSSRQLSVKDIKGGTAANGMDFLEFNVTGSFAMPAVVNGKTTEENTTASFIFNTVKDASTGKWEIAGFKNTFNVAPVA